MASRIADETLVTIIDAVLQVEDDDFSSFETELGPFAQREYSNADVLLVCKRWMRVGTPPLFHTCIIRSSAQAQALTKALKKNPFGAFVRRVRIEGAFGAAVKQFLEKTPNIQELAVTMPETSKDNAKPMFSMLGTLQLHRFTLCDYNWKENAQTQYAREAIINMLKTCGSLQELSMPLRATQALSLATIPCTISKFSTRTYSSSGTCYRDASSLLDKMPSLRSVEFLFSCNFRPGISGSGAVPRPQEDVVTTHGRHIYLRGKGERTGVTLNEFMHLKQQHEQRLATAFISVSGLPALERTPGPLQTDIWTLVLRDIVRRNPCDGEVQLERAYDRVCRRFRAIMEELRLEEFILAESMPALLKNKIASLSRRRTANTNFEPRVFTVAVMENGGTTRRANFGIQHDGPRPASLLACAIRQLSHLTVANLHDISLDTFILLGSVCGHSLVTLVIARVQRGTQTCSNEHTSLSLNALRNLSALGARYRTSDPQLTADWSSMSIHAPSLTYLVIGDEISTARVILPCLISGFLPQMQDMTVTAECEDSPGSLEFQELLRELLRHKGSSITTCVVPILIVPDVLGQCPLVGVIHIHGGLGPLHDIGSWRSIFGAHTVDEARDLSHIIFSASLSDFSDDSFDLNQLPDDVPSVFMPELYPALEEVQLDNYTWPTTPRKILESVAVKWVERFADRGITLVDSTDRPWRRRLLTKKARVRQSKQVEV